jgi:hypothetical protein
VREATEDPGKSVAQQLEDEQNPYFVQWRDSQRIITDTRRARDQAYKRLDVLERQCDLLTAIDATTITAPPKWLSPKKKSKGNVGIVNLILSDLHLDEVVFPAQIGGVNAYDRVIATGRLQRTAEQVVEVARDFFSGISYDGATIWMGGDIFSGNIHEELKITNEAPIMASFDYWIDPMVSAFKMIADQFGRVHVPGVVGNHGRNTYKPIMKNRVQDNFDWLFYRVLQRELAHDDRFTWQLPLSADVGVHQYSTRFLMTHGDQFRGGSGISGIMTPLNLGDFKKSKRQMAINDPYDYMLLGHFHQYMTLPRIIVNGSLKGYDEYASISNFGFEQPQQAFWITTPENGVTFSAPIRPQNRKIEKW